MLHTRHALLLVLGHAAARLLLDAGPSLEHGHLLARRRQLFPQRRQLILRLVER